MILFDKADKENYILHCRSYNFKFRLSTKSNTKCEGIFSSTIIELYKHCNNDCLIIMIGCSILSKVRKFCYPQIIHKMHNGIASQALEFLTLKTPSSTN